MRSWSCAFVLLFFLGFLIFSRPNVSAETPTQGGGMIYGWVYGFTWDDQLVPLVWVQVTASNPNYPTFTTSTGGNGVFQLYVPVGTYNLTVSPTGYKTQSSSVSVSEGSSSAWSFYLEESHVPVPEFPTQMATIVMVMGLAATMLTRRARKSRR